MSLARRAIQRKLAGQKFDFAARRAMLDAGQAARFDDGADDAGDAAAASADAPALARILAGASPAAARAIRAVAGRGTPASRLRMRKEAANENTIQDGSADLTPYDQMLLQLHRDKDQLKSIQSTEGKVALKRELLPAYTPWILGRLEAAAGGQRPSQDDVLVAVMIWSIDTGDYVHALELAAYCQRYDMAMPSKITRDLANFVTEEIAVAALAAYREAPGSADAFPGAILGDVEELFADVDMFDPVKAKLNKALGLAILAAVPADAADDQVVLIKKDALSHFKRARELDSASGCVKLIEGLERELKKITPGETDAS
ncbi:phage terminase small subunit [Brevundimonas sp. UBA7664]|uniref:phage terminase small subunit n=1 Tax=Brevundimonas sp. UBA7664 TaxID=1946141 RepID=UPI0025B7CC63|nr:phage terminase small subunit [Brevundimonas sp. UBA7664]